MSSFQSQKKKKEIRECNKILQELSRIKENSRCCDCGGYPAKWCSVNIGCFLCLRCSGIHRGLGTHISFVKSITLDDWNYFLLNKFKLLGGNKKVNQIYQATLKMNKKKDKINYTQFIHSKYVEKKWIKKQKDKKQNNEIQIDRKQIEKRRQKRVKKRKCEQKKIIKKHNPKPRIQKIEKQKSEQHFSINDNPSDWIKFPDDEHKTDFIVIKDNKPNNNDMIPDLLDFNSMQTFAFSDLASFNNDNNNNNNNQENESNKSQIEIKVDYNPRKSNKAAILSKYNNTPSTWITFQSPSPRNVEMSYNDSNVFQSYNPYHGFNQFNFVRPVINNNMNNMSNMNDNRQQRQQSIDNSFDINLFQPGMNKKRSMNKSVGLERPLSIDNSNEEQMIYVMSPINRNNNNNQNMMQSKFDPFDHIANLCNNNNGYYVYNSNVSC